MIVLVPRKGWTGSTEGGEEVVEAVAVLRVAVCTPVLEQAKKSDCRHRSGYLQSSRDLYLSDSNLPPQTNLCRLAIPG